MSQFTPVQSVRKAFDILNLLLFDDPQREGVALGEVARQLALPPATAHNLLQTLCHCGYASALGGGRYASGPRCREIAHFQQVITAATRQELATQLERVGHRLGETVVLALLANGRRIRLASFDAYHLVKIDTARIDAKSPFTTPTGRVLAAFAAPQERELMLQRYGAPTTDIWADAATDDGLERALAAIRHDGHAVIITSELTACAVPLLAHGGELLCALGYFAPTFRSPPAASAKVLTQLKEAATELSRLF